MNWNYKIKIEGERWILMKSLLDIQQDIRTLERNISDISNSIKVINSDIEKLRMNNKNMDIDYSKIEILAKNISFTSHPIDKLYDRRACEIYIKMLLNIVRLDLEEEVSINRLVFIQWLQKKSRIELSLEDLYKDCYKINEDCYYEMVDVIPKNYMEYFIVDALIVANISGISNTDIYNYIAGLVSILGIDKERLITLSFIAKTTLCQNIGQMKIKEISEFQKIAKIYKHYIKADILESGIKSMRQIVVKLSDEGIMDFKWKVKQGEKIKKDEVIATYKRVDIRSGFIYKRNQRIEEIKSPEEGTIFQFRNNCINYGVLSHENDDKDAIKAWVKEMR